MYLYIYLSVWMMDVQVYIHINTKTYLYRQTDCKYIKASVGDFVSAGLVSEHTFKTP